MLAAMAPALTAKPDPEALRRSQAFRQAALEGEVRRAYAVLVVVALVMLLVLQNRATRHLDARLYLVGAAGVGTLLLLQALDLFLARRALAGGRSLPLWFIVLLVVAEAAIPTAMMLTHILSGALAPFAALSAPPVLAYGLMITLTTLRLRPWLCLLAGTIAAAGYAGLLLYITLWLGITAPTTGLPLVAYVSAAILVLISGLAAAWVAHEIRRHLIAALDEAETKRRVARLEHDLDNARSIQQALLPREPPDIPGYEIAGWNRPADQTGGDYYDWQQMPGGTWLITLADVSGHGIGPAMVTAACRAYVRASTAEHRDLGGLTTRINQLLAQDLPEGRFITMAGVLIDPAGGPAALLSAGHGPIVLYAGASGEVVDIVPGGIPLAILPDERYGPPEPITMQAGDILALITDGFSEWSRPAPGGAREQFGLQRLKDSLHRHASLPAADLIQAVAADVAAFAGSERQQDDLTMVVIRRTAPRAGGDK